MKKALYFIAQVAVSIAFLGLSYLAIQYQGSVGLELGAGFLVFGFFHWVFWPKLASK